METQQQNIRSWDDLIFENRNKSYGAYALRQDYSNGLAKGAFTGLGILVSLLVIAGFARQGSSILPVPTCELPITTINPPAIIPIEKQSAIQPPVKKPNTNLAPVAVITPDPVEPDPEPAAVSSGTEGTPEGITTENGVPGGIPTTESGAAVVESKKEPFINVEIMPSYAGGFQGMMTTLKRNMKYPASARRTGKEGTAYVEFVVNDAGEITNVKLLRGFDTACDKEAVRIVSLLTEWSPGYQNKVPVNVKLVLPIKFQLEK